MTKKLQHETPRTDAAMAWLATAARGDRIEYHRGMLCSDIYTPPGTIELRAEKSERLDLIGVRDVFRWAFEQGQVHLVQRRHGWRDYSYVAVARSTSFRAAGGKIGG